MWTTEEAYLEVEQCILDLMRAGKNERAATLMNHAIAYKFAKVVQPSPLPPPPDLTPGATDNVYPMWPHRHADDNWSRKAPCS